MKKPLICLLTLLILLALAACGSQADVSPSDLIDLPDIPDEPINPDVPDISDEPINPDVPDISDEPINPDVSDIPDTPDLPDTPDIPDEPDTPDVPDEPQLPTVTVSYDAKVLNGGESFSSLPPLPAISFTLPDPENTRNLCTEKISHSFGAAKGGVAHSISQNNQKRFDAFGTSALAWDNKTEGKVIYLTFDCGYKYKDSVDQILNVLKEKQVPTAFFCTQDYLEDDLSAVARMINEGHIVGNHSLSHPSNCAALSREEMAREVLAVHNFLAINFGYNCRYFRFPAGVYSESVLDAVYSVGYRSVFWSLAHTDWDPEDQPGVQKSFDTVTSRLHPGAVILLHTTSPDNLAILADFIDYARAQGYTFLSLDDYGHWAG